MFNLFSFSFTALFHWIICYSRRKLIQNIEMECVWIFPQQFGHFLITFDEYVNFKLKSFRPCFYNICSQNRSFLRRRRLLWHLPCNFNWNHWLNKSVPFAIKIVTMAVINETGLIGWHLRHHIGHLFGSFHISIDELWRPKGAFGWG